VFSGWREMNDYMRENKIEAVTPQVVTQVARGKGEAADVDEAVARDLDGVPRP